MRCLSRLSRCWRWRSPAWSPPSAGRGAAAAAELAANPRHRSTTSSRACRDRRRPRSPAQAAGAGGAEPVPVAAATAAGAAGAHQVLRQGKRLLRRRRMGDQDLLRVLRAPGSDRAAGTSPQGYTRDEVIVGGFIDALFHELGHALFDILNIPVFGREEDAADQMSAFVMLQFGKEVARTTIRGAAFTYLNTKNPRTIAPNSPTSTARRRSASSTTSASPMAASPAAFQEFVDQGVLPKERAVALRGRVSARSGAHSRKTILPHIDQDLMKKVRARKWLRPDDGLHWQCRARAATAWSFNPA